MLDALLATAPATGMQQQPTCLVGLFGAAANPTCHSSSSSPAPLPNTPKALHTVATAFLAEEDLPGDLRAGVVEHMVGVHQSARRASARFEQQLKRYNYVTVSRAGLVDPKMRPRGR